jgi:hypothetical protein
VLEQHDVLLVGWQRRTSDRFEYVGATTKSELFANLLMQNRCAVSDGIRGYRAG